MPWIRDLLDRFTVPDPHRESDLPDAVGRIKEADLFAELVALSYLDFGSVLMEAKLKDLICEREADRCLGSRVPPAE